MTVLEQNPLAHRKKYEQLADTLRDRLKSPGSSRKLPSVRMLMRRFQISQHTVMAALRLLEKEDLISRKPASGIYVSEHRTVIAYFRPVAAGNQIDHKEHAFVDACERRGWILHSHDFQSEKVDLFMEEIHADAFVVNPAMITFKSPILSNIIESKKPLVVLGRDTANLNLDFVVGDNALTLAEVMKGLLQRGHRRLAYLVSEPQHHEVDEVVRLFRQLCEAFPINHYEVLTPNCRFGENGLWRCEEFLAEYIGNLPRGRLPFTALITHSHCGSIPALRALHNAGLRVPQDCSLFCMGLDQTARFFIPSISNIVPHHEERVESCLQIIEKRMAGDTSPLLFDRGINSPCWRESVGPVPAEPGAKQKRPAEKHKGS